VSRGCRYGEAFTTNIFGRKVTVLNSPDAARFVLSTAHSSFVHGYGMRRTELAGNGKFWGPGHAYCRKIVLAATTGENLHNILPFISRLAKRTVDSWEDMGVVNTCDEIRKVSYPTYYCAHSQCWPST
jgi:cytochrome P450